MKTGFTWKSTGKYAGQRERIYAEVRLHAQTGLQTIDILKEFQNNGDESVRNMRIEPIRRCLQELLKRDLVTKVVTGLDHRKGYPIVRWYPTVQKAVSV